MGNRKIKWNSGDVFAVLLGDKTYSIGQVLDLRWPQCVRCAFYEEKYTSVHEINIAEVCKNEHLISLIEVTRVFLDSGMWMIIGNKEINISKEKYPNEQFRDKQWVGAVTSDAGLAEDFLNAFYGITAWDNWFDPNYLDGYLIDPLKKPKNRICIKSK